MCGICGIAPHDSVQPVERATIERMAATLRHRGPDGDGFHVVPGIGLGFRRLGIVDLETGDQPIASEDGEVVVVCNGEIYNSPELRRELTGRGHRFSTRSDVEVIVHLYEELGDGLLERLRGMFALALWDARRRRLLLARDRVGIKPLHYALTAQGLVFGSEQKALLASGAVDTTVDPQALRQLFAYGHVVSPRTLFAGIRRLAAGHMLVWRDGRAEQRRWWDPLFPARRDYDRARPARAWAEELRGRLAESVRSHLLSDVPVGAWLSGGIDSSAVTALMAGMVEPPLDTFTLRFDEPDFDELTGRRALDDFPQYGLRGHRVVCGRADLELLPEALRHTEDVFLGGPGVGQLRLAEATAASVKCVLAGEGADEALGGYSWYPTMRLLAPGFALPGGVRRRLGAMRPLRRRWPGAAHTLAGPREVDFDRYSRSISHHRALAAGPEIFSAAVLESLAREAEPEDSHPVPDGFASWHPFARMQYFDLKHRLPDLAVLRLDRMSMARSVEARVPFLDHELLAFCARIPPRVKLRWLGEKSVLRRAMAGVLPPELARRPKHAFQVPADRWLTETPTPLVEECLTEPALADAGLFDPAGVARLRRRIDAGETALRQTLLGVFGAQLWHRTFRRAGTTWA